MSAIPLGAKVIANWQPSELDNTVVWREWLALATKLCGSYLRDNAVVRSPDHVHSAGFRSWHHDNYRHSPPHGPRIYVLMWSNILPTLVRLTDGTPLKAKAGDVILADNDLVVHRTDKRVGKHGGKRWFARVMILHGESKEFVV